MATTSVQASPEMATISPRSSPRSLPRSPPMEYEESQAASSASHWMRGQPMFQKEEKEETVCLLAMDEKIHIPIEQEKVVAPVQLVEDSNWITADDIAKMGNLPYLSGMRAAASFAIQAYHLFKPGTRSVAFFGSIALSTYFVQGAFLITGALLSLQKSNHGKGIFHQHTHLPRFFIGRWVRLYPALILMIIVTAIWWQERHDRAVHLAKAIFRTMFKIQHTKILYVSDDDPPNPFAHTWFLDVQEAFYLFWALALPFIAMLGTKRRTLILAILFGYSLHRRMKENTFNATLSINMWKMVAGAGLQLIPIPRSFVQQYSRSIATITITLVVLWGSSAVLHDNFSDKSQRIQGDLIGVFVTFVVTMAALSQNPNGSSQRITLEGATNPELSGYWTEILSAPLEYLNTQWLDFIGRISYSWYLWQIPILHFEDNFCAGYEALGSTCEAFIIAMCSTLWMEEPIRDWYRNRLRRQKMAAMIAKQEAVGR